MRLRCTPQVRTVRRRGRCAHPARTALYTPQARHGCGSAALHESKACRRREEDVERPDARPAGRVRCEGLAHGEEVGGE